MQFVRSSRFRRQYKKQSAKNVEKLHARLRIFAEDEFNPTLGNRIPQEKFFGCRSINITGDVRLMYRKIGGVCHLLLLGTHSELYS
jgi:mRNA-degrading endonuclease YafQ of YafQ-DinJ toxin-antitoxin module